MPFTIERNDLANVKADAIVVAANERLQITGGVGLTVALVAGLDELQAACNEIGFCPCGSAVATPAFGLDAKIVVHAVGPIWMGGSRGEADFLRSAYDSALECAASGGARSIALPLISAGTYGFPASISLAVARESIRTFLNRREDIDVRLVLYSRESVAAGMDAYLEISEYIDDHYVDSGFSMESMVLNAPSMLPSRPMVASAQEPGDRRAKQRRGLASRLGEAIEGVKAGRDRPEAEEAATPMPTMAAAPAGQRSLEDLLSSLDEPFSTTLLALIDERGMTDVQVYKRANMSRQLFSNIRSDANYRPTKKTALALAIALGLDLGETKSLLVRAGFTLSHSSKSDVIVEYFIERGSYDIFEINEALYAFDQPIL